MWAVVACSIDGRLLPHLEALGGGHARRGLSLSVYAAMCENAVRIAPKILRKDEKIEDRFRACAYSKIR